jgi:hypothetical protein
MNYGGFPTNDDPPRPRRSPVTEQQNTEPPAQPEGHGRHAAPEGAPRDPRIDISRDPTPGVPDHAAPEGDDEED